MLECDIEIVRRLCKLEIFSDFTADNPEHVAILEKVCTRLDKKSYQSGSIILREGDQGDCLHILFEGTVQIKRNTPSDEQFAVVNLSAEQNVFFGEVALVDHDTRSASVYAITNCKTLCLDAESFIALCNEEPLLGYHVMYRISRRIASSLRRSNKDLMTLYEALIDEVHGED